MPAFRNRTSVIVILLLLLSVIVGVFVVKHRNNDPSSKQLGLNVVTSYYPLYDFAHNVGGEKVNVSNITPSGSEPHDYEPSPQQLVSANKSDVFIYNGGTLEPWVDKFLPEYSHIAVKASSGIDIAEGTPEADKVADGPIEDPHFWLDPILAAKIVDNIRDGLIAADPKDAVYFTERADAYKVRLVKLDMDFKNGLVSCLSRTIVTSHDAFSYLARRYNLDVVSIAGLNPDEEPSAAKLAELTRLIREKHISYVFFESLVSPKLAETIANETGAKTAVFDPIEGISDADQKQGKDYLHVQQENLANLRTTLACK